MNRKNLTAAVLAGLAGAAGLAGTAQAVNLNPDGLGQVLIYPYYTSNDGNQTVLSVVNTTDQAKAVKVRFLEGYNSREVLDFNLYLSAYDVWVAAIADGAGFDASQAGVPHLVVPDTSCTVPYLYGDGIDAGLDFGLQAFLPYAYSGKNNDGGPNETVGGPIPRAAEGHFEMIEMGTLIDADTAYPKTGTTPARPGAATAATHVVTADGPMPLNCNVLVENWTGYGANKPHPVAGVWFEEAKDGIGDIDQAESDTRRNSGGLFGGAAIINPTNGTMFSYDAKALQGFDKSENGIHFTPGTRYPSLDSGSSTTAWIAFGTPTNRVEEISYSTGVDAVSAVFMHDYMMNTYTIEEDLRASSEFVFTFPTKSFYVDEEFAKEIVRYFPNPEDPGCNGWDPGEPFPPWDGSSDKATGWEQCEYLKSTSTEALAPFTEVFDGTACEIADIEYWDREEAPSTPGTPGNRPPIVSPPPPPGSTPPGDEPFALCYEVNRLVAGEGLIFGETDLVSYAALPFEAGWVKVNFSYKVKGVEQHVDSAGLVGLPVTGFTAEEYENDFAEGDGVKAFYGGVYQHKASVRRMNPQ